MALDDRSVSAGDVAVGDTGPTIEVDPVDRLDFVKYAGASGDFVRVHVDEAHARSLGHDSVFQHGMLTAAYAARLLTDWFGPAALVSFSTRFEAIVWPGDRLTIDGSVRGKTPRGDHVDLDVELVARTEDGVVLAGDATVRLPETV